MMFPTSTFVSIFGGQLYVPALVDSTSYGISLFSHEKRTATKKNIRCTFIVFIMSPLLVQRFEYLVFRFDLDYFKLDPHVFEPLLLCFRDAVFGRIDTVADYGKLVRVKADTL